VHFVGADDTHGAAIMLRAEAEGVTRTSWWQKSPPLARNTSTAFISYDHWGSTDARQHGLCRILLQAQTGGLIYAKPVEQFFDPVKAMFLPDRYIKAMRNAGQGSIRRRLRELQLGLFAHRSYQSLFESRVRRRCSDLRHFFFRPIRSALHSCRNGR
jgi:hypothetical protein